MSGPVVPDSGAIAMQLTLPSHSPASNDDFSKLLDYHPFVLPGDSLTITENVSELLEAYAKLFSAGEAGEVFMSTVTTFSDGLVVCRSALERFVSATSTFSGELRTYLEQEAKTFSDRYINMPTLYAITDAAKKLFATVGGTLNGALLAIEDGVLDASAWLSADDAEPVGDAATSYRKTAMVLPTGGDGGMPDRTSKWVPKANVPDDAASTISTESQKSLEAMRNPVHPLLRLPLPPDLTWIPPPLQGWTWPPLPEGRPPPPTTLPNMGMTATGVAPQPHDGLLEKIIAQVGELMKRDKRPDEVATELKRQADAVNATTERLNANVTQGYGELITLLEESKASTESKLEAATIKIEDSTTELTKINVTITEVKDGVVSEVKGLADDLKVILANYEKSVVETKDSYMAALGTKFTDISNIVEGKIDAASVATAAAVKKDLDAISKSMTVVDKKLGELGAELTHHITEEANRVISAVDERGRKIQDDIDRLDEAIIRREGRHQKHLTEIDENLSRRTDDIYKGLGETKSVLSHEVTASQTALTAKIEAATAEIVGSTKTTLVTNIGETEKAMVSRIDDIGKALRTGIDTSQQTLTGKIVATQTDMLNAVGSALKTDLGTTQQELAASIANASSALAKDISTAQMTLQQRMLYGAAAAGVSVVGIIIAVLVA